MSWRIGELSYFVHLQLTKGIVAKAETHNPNLRCYDAEQIEVFPLSVCPSPAASACLCLALSPFFQTLYRMQRRGRGGDGSGADLLCPKTCKAYGRLLVEGL